MKKILALLLITFSCQMLNAQSRPIDSLYIWVKYSEEKIVLDIPESYMTLKSQPSKLPKHVSINQVPIFVPSLPKKDELIASLLRELKSNSNPVDSDNQLKYIGTVALLLYYSNNDSKLISDEINSTLNNLSKNPSVTKEAQLVGKWIDMLKP